MLSVHYCNVMVYVVYCSVGEKRRTRQTFLMARPKCLMGNFTNSYRIYKAHQTNVWWTMKVFRLHWYCVASGKQEKVQACLVTLWLFIISCHSLYKTTIGSLCSWKPAWSLKKRPHSMCLKPFVKMCIFVVIQIFWSLRKYREQATVLDARASRVKWPAQFMSHCYGILFTE